MSVNTKNIIDSQLDYFKKAVVERIDLLKGRGFDDISISKDRRLQSLRGKLRQINRRSLTISNIQKRFEAVRSGIKIAPAPVRIKKRKGKSSEDSDES